MVKNMTTEQKARAYDKALALMKDCIPDKDGYVCVRPCDIFSELKESEDEQHRKWILEYLYDGLRKSDEQYKDQFKAAINWLQKQVKETAISQHENKTCKENDDSLTCENERIRGAIIDHLKDNNLTEWAAWLEKRKDYVSPQMVADAYLRGCNDTEKKWLEKQGQAFPILSNSSNNGKKWTEEDEDLCQDALDAFEALGNDLNPSEDWGKLYDWLKQLKQRIQQHGIDWYPNNLWHDADNEQPIINSNVVVMLKDKKELEVKHKVFGVLKGYYWCYLKDILPTNKEK